MPLRQTTADGDRPDSHHRQPLVRTIFVLSGYAAIAVILVCTLALCGYGFGWRWAWRPMPDGRAIHPLSALGFIAIGGMALVSRPYHRSRINLIVASGLAIAAAAVLVTFVAGHAGAINDVSPFGDVLRAEALARRMVRISPLTAATIVLLATALLLQHRGNGEPALLLVATASVAPTGAMLGYAYGLPSFEADIGPITTAVALLSAFAIVGRSADQLPLRSMLTGVPGRLVRAQMLVLVGLCLFLAMIAARSGFDDDIRTLTVEVSVIAVVIVLTLVNAGYRWRREEQRAAATRRRGLDHPLASVLDGAWDRGEMFLLYQPQIRLADGAMAGVEALVRWRHPTRGLVPPDDFIPLAEQTGLIVPLGAWIFAAACAEVARWQHGPLSGLVVAVNVSAHQLNQDGCAERLIALQRDAGVRADRLVIEVTESTLIERGDKALHALRRLNEAGLLIAIDDFGTGFSSLSSLRLLPGRYLKIDRSLVEPLPDSESAAMIVRAAVGMGRGLGMRVVAEGVETVEQAIFLAQIGCEKAQGYLYGAPMTAEEIAARVDP